MCLNKKVIAGLIAAAVVIYLIAPGSVGAALPLLLIAACPLSVLVMMWAMSRGRSNPSGESDARSPATDDEVARLRAEVAELRDGANRVALGAGRAQPENRSPDRGAE